MRSPGVVRMRVRNAKIAGDEAHMVIPPEIRAVVPGRGRTPRAGPDDNDLKYFKELAIMRQELCMRFRRMAARPEIGNATMEQQVQGALSPGPGDETAGARDGDSEGARKTADARDRGPRTRSR